MNDLDRLEDRVGTAARLLREASVALRTRARAEEDLREEGRRAEAARLAGPLRQAIAALRGER